MSVRLKTKRRRFEEDFPYFARRCLSIKTKDDGTQPLILNAAQEYIHEKLEEQLEKTGKVRALILKGRQQGCSTYVEGRFMWRTSLNKSKNAFILTHLDDATQNIFNMSKRYYDNLPRIVKPELAASNAKELKFNKLDSGFRVGTAKSTGTGRSNTIQYFHGSEVAFWHDAETHFSGAIQAVPKSVGTEIILESTANGMGGRFHDMCKAAIAGKGEYQLIFVPWFWQEEYTQDVPKGFAPTGEEAELMEVYGLTLGQLVWRRNKIEELGSVGLFKQEYPCNPQEAFSFSGQESYIPIQLVERAAKTKFIKAMGPRILGADVATPEGKDSTAFCLRQGRVIHWFKVEPTWGPAKAKRYIIQMFEDGLIDECNVDGIGVGCGLYDELTLTKWSDFVHCIKSSQTAMRDDKYCLVRDEMYGNFKDWLEDTPCMVPDDVMFIQDTVTAGWRKQNGKIKIESKDEIKKRIGRSTDVGDSAQLTTARESSAYEKAAEKFTTPSSQRTQPKVGGIA